VDNLATGNNPGPCGKPAWILDQNKTAVNKGVWEFRQQRQPPGAHPAAGDAAARNSRELGGVLTPPIVKAIP